MDPITIGVLGLVALIALKFFAKQGSSGGTATTAAAAGDDQPPGVQPWQSKMIADVLNDHQRRKARAEVVAMASEAIEAEQE